MSERDNKIGIDIRSTYSGTGATQASADLDKLDKKVNESGVEAEKAKPKIDDFDKAVESAGVEAEKAAPKVDNLNRTVRETGQEMDRARPRVEGHGQALDAAGRAGEATARHHHGLQIAVAGARLAVLAAGTAALAYTAIQIKLGMAWARSAEQLATLAEKSDQSVETLSLMRLEAEQSDVSLEKVSVGLKNLSVKMFEAHSGGTKAQALFRALGVEYVDSTGKLRSARDVMDDISTRFAEMQNGAGKTGFATKFLGRTLGEELIPYLNNGGDALRGMREEARQLGHVIDTDTAKAMKQLKDDVNALDLTMQGAAGELAGPFIRALRNVFAEMRAAAKEGLFPALLAGYRTLMTGTDQHKWNVEFTKAGEMLMIAERQLAAMRNGSQRGMRPASPEELAAQERSVREAQAEMDRLINIRDANAPGFLGQPAPKRPAPGLGADEDAGVGRVARGPKAMTFDELLANNARKREQMVDQAERDADREAEQRAKALEREADAMAKLGQQYREMIDPVEQWRRKVREVDEAMGKGLNLTTEEYAAVMRYLEDRMTDATLKLDGFNGKIKETAADGLPELKAAIEGWGRDVSRSLGRAAVDGKLSLSTLADAFKNLAAEIAAVQIQKRLMDPIIKGATNWLDGLFGVPTNHTGGIVGIDRGPARYVHGSAFAAAPRLHRGGIAGDEQPTILQRGEGVFTPAQMRALGGARNVRVEIVNQGAGKVVESAEPRIDVEGMIVRVVLADQRQGGPITRGMQSTFGLRRAAG